MLVLLQVLRMQKKKTAQATVQQMNLPRLTSAYNWDTLTDHLSTSCTHQCRQNCSSHPHSWVKLHQLTFHRHQRTMLTPNLADNSAEQALKTSGFWNISAWIHPFAPWNMLGTENILREGKESGQQVLMEKTDTTCIDGACLTLYQKDIT